MKRGPRRRRLMGLLGLVVAAAAWWAGGVQHLVAPGSRPCGDDVACMR